MKEDKSDFFIPLTIIILVIGGLIIQPYFEARAFNKHSDTKASYWDACWSQLRITAQ